MHMGINALPHLFSEFNSKTVMVIGDVMVDTYLWGIVDRISPEAPVPVVAVHKKDHRLGGAANVAVNLKELGAKPVLISVIGDDRDGKMMKELLIESQIGINTIISSSNRPTTVKTRVISGHQHMLRIDDEITESLNDSDRQHVFAMVQDHLDETDIIVLQDYDKGVLSQELIKQIIDLAHSKGTRVFVDPKKKNFLAYKDADVMKPNLKELREGLNLDLPHEFSIENVELAAKKLREMLGLDMALITLSENGIYVGSNDEQHHIKAHIRDIYDVSGAGDTVIAIAALMLACGAGIRLVAEVANLGGGLVCEKVGVVPVEKQRLLEEAIKMAHG